MLAGALIGFEVGQASLAFDGSTRYGARDSIVGIGTGGAAASDGLDLNTQPVELHTENSVGRPTLSGSWFNDGFAGAMGELPGAIEDKHEPLHSARANLATIELLRAPFVSQPIDL